MGCWGITALESDAGLDAVGFIRDMLPDDGGVHLEQVLKALKEDNWNAPDAPALGYSHTSPMALTEIMLKVMDNTSDELDYDEEWAEGDRKFSALTSFTADKASIVWMRDYLEQNLAACRRKAVFRARQGDPYGGWFEEKNWIGWQKHMESLISRLDELIAQPEPEFELIKTKEIAENEETEHDLFSQV